LGSESSGEGRQRFGLWSALALSILLHVLFMVFTVWFPITRGASVAVADVSDDTITFTFDRESEATTDDPLEDARFTPASLPIPESAQAPPVETFEPEAVEALPEEFQAPEEVVQPEEPLETPGADLAERPEGMFRQAPTRESAPDRSLETALRDFGRALASRPPPPPASESFQGTPQNVIVPDLSGVPASGFGVGNLVFESRDYDWSDYGRQIYMAIWRAWHNRLYVTTDDFEKWAYRNDNWRLAHTTEVRFVIEGNGQVTGIVEESGSGCDPLDASVLDALSEVILPPLPADFPRDQEIVHARFIADGPVRAMRPVLRRYKLMGLF